MNDNIQTKKKENLIAINEWCKTVGLDDYVYISKALCYKDKYYQIRVNKDGLSACKEDSDSNWMFILDGYQPLYCTEIGAEIIYNWHFGIKQKILDAIEDYKKKQELMNNFEV